MGALTQARLKELLTYDPDTGLFRWNVSRGKAIAGAIAGTTRDKGHIQIFVDGRAYRAHRLAYLYVEGRFPTAGVDHRNGQPNDNSWSNLRHATQAQNTLNRGAQSNSRTGVKNVTRHPDSGFVVRMKTAGGYKHLGCFKTVDEAAAFAARARAQHHGEFANHGTPA